VSGIPFFLRFDDITDLDARIVRFVEGSLANGFPVLAAVIPEQLHPDATEWLIKLRGKYPQLLDIAQHGYRHKDHFSGAAHGEFCQGRADKLIAQDILAGAVIMDDAFGDEWQRIFVPPFNHICRYAIQVLIRMRFLGVSTIYSPPDTFRKRFSMCRDMIAYQFGSALPAWKNMWRVEGRLPCVSPVIDVGADYAGSRLASTNALDEMVSGLISAEGQVLGIMIHHWLYRDMTEIDDLLAWGKRVRDRCELSPVSVSQLIRDFS